MASGLKSGGQPVFVRALIVYPAFSTSNLITRRATLLIHPSINRGFAVLFELVAYSD
jgi:hypothetical protein